VAEPNRAPTISDVAALAGVSSATVSYVLSGRRNGDHRISEETQHRVLHAVETLGYVPNQTARHLRRRRTERVCLALPHLGIPSYDLLAAQLDRAAEAHGYTTVIAVLGSAEREQRVFDQLRRGLADGAIVVSEHSLAHELTPIVQAGVALVTMSNFPAPAGADSVQTTEEETTHEAICFLTARGHRRIGFIGDAGMAASPWRFQGYRRALREQGIPDADCLCTYYGTASREQAYRCAAQMLSHSDRPTAIFAATDLAAISAIWAARDAGLRIPQDIAVIGAGNIPEGAITSPPLTTIGPLKVDYSPVFTMLFSRLAGEAPEAGRAHVIPWQLIERSSA